jgi:hypothetical protein
LVTFNELDYLLSFPSFAWKLITKSKAIYIHRHKVLISEISSTKLCIEFRS